MSEKENSKKWPCIVWAGDAGMSLTYKSIEFGQQAVISETQIQRFGGGWQGESIDIF